MGPKALQSGQHIAVLRQFHLRLGFCRLGAHGKDVENQTRTVQYLDLQFALDITDLLGTQFVVEDYHSHGLRTVLVARYDYRAVEPPMGVHPLIVGILLLFDILLDFLELTLAHIRHLTWALHLLRKALQGHGTGSIGQEFQLVQIFFCLGLVLLLGNQSYQHRSLRLDLRNYKFLHTLL